MAVIYLLLLYVIFHQTGVNLAHLRAQQQGILEDGLQGMYCAVHSKYRMFRYSHRDDPVSLLPCLALFWFLRKSLKKLSSGLCSLNPGSWGPTLGFVNLETGTDLKGREC